MAKRYYGIFNDDAGRIVGLLRETRDDGGMDLERSSRHGWVNDPGLITKLQEPDVRRISRDEAQPVATAIGVEL